MGLFDTTPEWDEAMNSWQRIDNAPAKRNRRRLTGVRAMQNEVLEKVFCTSHWATPALWFFPPIGYSLYACVNDFNLTAGQTAGYFAIGVVGWTLAEYLIHRFFFHMDPGDNKVLRALLFIAHGYHHEFPQDPGRLVAPPILAWPIGLSIALFYFLVAPSVWPALFAGTCSGYLAYDWTHYYTHHAKPTTKLGKFMRRFHFEHHYKDKNTQFGLSQPIWDYVFGSYRRPTKPTAAEVECLTTFEAQRLEAQHAAK